MADLIRKERKWWQKKTNWGLLLIGISEAMYSLDITSPYAEIVRTFGMLIAGYGVADRAGKPPETKE